jgi:hypothetical protein
MCHAAFTSAAELLHLARAPMSERGLLVTTLAEART